MKRWKPIFIENSRVPVWLSKLSPMSFNAISFGLFVWSRGRLTERVKIHETIHYQQQLELLFVFQWLLYSIFWLWGLIRYRSFKQAYRENPFEREALVNESSQTYLPTRSRYNWRRYI